MQDQADPAVTQEEDASGTDEEENDLPNLVGDDDAEKTYDEAKTKKQHCNCHPTQEASGSTESGNRYASKNGERWGCTSSYRKR